MTKPELGTKRRCNSCATKFFDLNKDPIICAKCAAVFVPPVAATVSAMGRSRMRRREFIAGLGSAAASLEEGEEDEEQARW